MKRLFRIWMSVVTLIAVILSFTAATYAWFTSNKSAYTNTVIARASDIEYELQLSETGIEDFRSVEIASIIQVNDGDAMFLMPVSTADLKTFVYCPATVEGMAKHFVVDENETYLYHGRIYLRAMGESGTGKRMLLYFDMNDGNLGVSTDGELLNAARLGLTFTAQNQEYGMIFRLTEQSNETQDQVSNTYFHGELLTGGKVLQSYPDGRYYPADDESKLAADYAVRQTENGLAVPDEPLLSMEMGTVYTLDVYFYIEGCDPDCSDVLSFDETNLHLAFFGVVQ